MGGSGGRPQMVVCGDNALAYRLVESLVSQLSIDVTVIMPSAKRGHGRRIAGLPRVRIVEAVELNTDAFQNADVAAAVALALVEQDDVGNIHAALRAQELNAELRLVIRFFNMSLGHRIRTLFPDCVVLSDSATAAPSFVAAALGEVTPSYVRLPGRPRRTVYVARPAEVPTPQRVCGLVDSTAPEGPQLLPGDGDRADLVLALVDGGGDPSTPPRAKRARRWHALWSRLAAVLNGKLAVAALGLLGLLGLGTVLFATVGGHSLSDALYLTMLDAAGAAQPDTSLSAVDKITQTMVTIVGISIIPLVTVTVVDAIVRARLADALGEPQAIAGHVVVVGLGNVGTRVVSQLHEQGIHMVCVERDEQARGIPLARRLGLPVVIGDASREDTLREAYLGTSRALVAVTSNDVTNLETALHGRAMNADLRVVLRLLDDDLAERVERNFGITISRSVSFLAAPAFAAAMTRRQVLGTIPVGREVLLIAEVPIQTGSRVIGQSPQSVHIPGHAKLIALQPRAADGLDMPPPQQHTLAAGDRLIMLATTTGLTHLQASTSASASPDIEAN